MAITNMLAPIPKWVLINNQGTVAGGAYLYTYRSLNKVQQKIVYQDAGFTTPWTNPIIFDLNGVQGPFYWTVDSANLDDTYYLEAWTADKNDPNSGAQLLWTLDDYLPPGAGGGGGGNTITYLPLTNYIANNQFIDHIDNTTNPIGVNATNLVIAPSNHKGFTPALISPKIGTHGAVGPDIRFVKSGTSNNDQITFPLFSLGEELTDDVIPVNYIRYQCTTSNPGETYKAFQFPITQKVQNLTNQEMAFKIWAAVTSSPVSIQANIRQYFGSGTGASAEVLEPIGIPLPLTTTWTEFTRNFVVPDVSGKSIGTLGLQTDDDSLYIQLEMPHNIICDIIFTKPALYLGHIVPDQEFETYDQINSINSTPRTGDIKTSLSSSAPNGWVAMNDGSIGNVGSGATNRANKDTFQLYSTIYTGVIDAWAPVSTGRTAPGNTMTAAIADFLLGKRLTLPRSLGRALAGAGSGSLLTTRALGEFGGVESHQLTISEMPSHSHTPLSGVAFIQAGGAVSLGASAGVSESGAATTGFTGGGPPGGPGVAFSIMEPTSFMNVFIKL